MTVSANTENSLSENEKLNNLISSYKKTVPNFYDENVCEEIIVPVPRGTIKVFHHKPDNPIAKRPIIFIPGFGTATRIWRDFHFTHHGDVEYYHIETADKKSSQIKRGLKTKLTVDRIAKDIAKTIEYLGMKDKDYVLVGACMNGGAVLHGLSKNYFKPPTTIVSDPFTKWTQNRLLVRFLLPILPPIIFGALKYVFARMVMRDMTNEEQIQRNKATVEEAIAWKWRKFAIQNINLDLTNDLSKITEEVIVIHGPPDKYHPEGTYKKVAERIPYGRFFHLKVKNEIREIMIGAFATEFAKINKEEGTPELLQPYEVDLIRNSD